MFCDQIYSFMKKLNQIVPQVSNKTYGIFNIFMFVFFMILFNVSGISIALELLSVELIFLSVLYGFSRKASIDRLKKNKENIFLCASYLFFFIGAFGFTIYFLFLFFKF